MVSKLRATVESRQQARGASCKERDMHSKRGLGGWTSRRSTFSTSMGPWVWIPRTHIRARWHTYNPRSGGTEAGWAQGFSGQSVESVTANCRLSGRVFQKKCGDMIEENIPVSSSGLHMCLLTHLQRCNACTHVHRHLGITFLLLETQTSNAEYLLRAHQ